MKRLVDFMNEVKVELRKVSWPTRKQAVKYTGMVILVSFALGIFIGLIDYGLTRALTYIIKWPWKKKRKKKQLKKWQI